MIIRPCSTCHLRKGCVRHDYITCEFSCHRDVDLKSLIAKIKCDWFDRLYSPGTRVSVELHRYESGSSDYNDHSVIEEGDFSGTIIRAPKKRKVAVWMDENDDVIHKIVNVPIGRLTFISEFPVNTCPDCGCPDGKKNHNEWFCEKCGGKP